MQVYAGVPTHMPYSDLPEYVQRIEAMGYDGIRVPDTVHDGMMTATLVAANTQRVRILSAVIVAFPRSPMLLAYGAWELARFSRGRFALGLGTQVRGNIEGRYGVPWTPPVQRMREYMQVLRQAFAAFQHGSRVHFEGEDYRITRLQPRFNPGPHDYPDVPLLLGAVGPGMLKLAGEQADGIITHGSNTNPRYLQQVTLPMLEAGAERAGRGLDAFELNLTVELVTGATKAEIEARRARVRETLAFYFSTPAYWPTLELYGWSELGHELREMTRQGRWAEMAQRVSDEMLEELAVQGGYEEIADAIKERFGAHAQGIGFPVPEDPSHDRQVAAVIRRLQEA